VIEGFERALDVLPDPTLTMVFGTDELLALVAKRIRRSAALAARVRLVGPVARRDMPTFMSAADLFVVGSHHEGSGYALMEAIACGAIPVVTDIPSFRAISRNGAFGALWEPGDPTAFARALVEVSRQDRALLRSRALDHAVRHLTWSAVGERAMQIYCDILARRGR
jgi:glycosyltransferase involved in cell wall biosynthesis